MPGLKEEEKSLVGGNGTKVIRDELSPNPETWIFMTLDGVFYPLNHTTNKGEGHQK